MVSRRIETAASIINKGDVIVDVGCDHGYLGLYAENRGAKKIVFIDNKEEPLNKAYLNTKDIIINAKCEYLLSDGLEKIKNYQEIDKIFILGMGGENIIHILDSTKNNIDDRTLIILDAHTKIPSLREYLFSNYFQIIKEIIVKENNHYYELIVIQKSDDLVSHNELDIMFGPLLRKEKSPIFIEKWQKKLKKNELILKNKPNVYEINKESELIKEVL